MAAVVRRAAVPRDSRRRRRVVRRGRRRDRRLAGTKWRRQIDDGQDPGRRAVPVIRRRPDPGARPLQATHRQRAQHRRAVRPTVATLLWKNRRAYEIAYFWGLVGASNAVITPGGLYAGFPEYRFFQYFIAHSGIVLGCIFATWGLGLRPTLAGLIRGICRSEPVRNSGCLDQSGCWGQTTCTSPLRLTVPFRPSSSDRGLGTSFSWNSSHWRCSWRSMHLSRSPKGS